MSTTDPVIARVARANPAPAGARGLPDDRAAAERTLARVLAQPVTRPGRRPQIHVSGRMLVPVLSTAVVVFVAVLFIRAGAQHGRPTAAAGGSGGASVTFQVLPSPRSGVTQRAISREVTALRARSDALGLHDRISASGADLIVVRPGAGEQRSRVASELGASANLAFYDWEGDALTPSGQAVASAFAAHSPGAMSISQGNGTGAPGSPGAGGQPLYDAVRLAARQRAAAATSSLSRLGSVYYLFGAPGSTACARAARDDGTTELPGMHCLLAGPFEAPASSPTAELRAQLSAGLPSGVSYGEGELLAVPQGTVVLQAQSTQPGAAVPAGDPSARFFVLRDRVALTGNGITDQTPGSDQSGEPDVQFRFTAAGGRAFQSLTAQIAHRGLEVSTGATYNQHFAVAIDGRLITIAQLDFRQYPNGIASVGSADLAGGFTRASARALAAELRAGALPLQLRLVR